MRIFIGIKINPNAVFLNVYNVLKDTLCDDGIKWVNSSNLHLTLRFLGEIDSGQLNLLKDALKRMDNEKPIEFAIEGVGFFKNRKAPKVLFFKLKNTKQLHLIQNRVENIVIKCGFQYENRAYKPHLTLGRIKYLNKKNRFFNLLEKYKHTAIQKVECTELIIFQSVLQPTGPQYVPLLNVQLNG